MVKKVETSKHSRLKSNKGKHPQLPQVTAASGQTAWNPHIVVKHPTWKQADSEAQEPLGQRGASRNTNYQHFLTNPAARAGQPCNPVTPASRHPRRSMAAEPPSSLEEEPQPSQSMP
ncbi:hypothetical protein AMECASPLE_039187 [Ameca splendens]|uniref:Uncharacterized protein n=1 Tax=Ameca splendens TaxID=208324 RepID=A0ABV0ZH44_9TELE